MQRPPTSKLLYNGHTIIGQNGQYSILERPEFFRGSLPQAKAYIDDIRKLQLIKKARMGNPYEKRAANNFALSNFYIAPNPLTFVQ